MNAHAYGAEKMTQGRESEYSIQLSRPQVEEVVREQRRLRIRQRPLLARLWAAPPRILVMTARVRRQVSVAYPRVSAWPAPATR